MSDIRTLRYHTDPAYRNKLLSYNRETHREIVKDIKSEMVIAYGGCCAACGTTDEIVLVLDHIWDQGNEDKERYGYRGGFQLYRVLRRLGWPQGDHQLLCHNCNYRKEYFRVKANLKPRI